MFDGLGGARVPRRAVCGQLALATPPPKGRTIGSAPMTTVLHSLSSELGVSDSRISLVSRRGGMRTLLVDDEPAYKISIDCGTCGYLLSRLEGSNNWRSIGELPDQLSSGLN